MEGTRAEEVQGARAAPRMGTWVRVAQAVRVDRVGAMVAMEARLRMRSA